MRKNIALIVMLFTRLYPLLSGQHKIANSKILKNITHGIGSIKCKVYNHRLCLDLGDSCGRSVFFFGGNDGKIVECLKKFLREDSVFVNVGANHGEHLFHAASLISKSGRVIGFEPQKQLSENIRNSLQMAESAKIEIFQIGLSNSNQTHFFKLTEGNSGVAEVLAHQESTTGLDGYEIVLKRGDDLLDSINVDKIDLLLVDVEGHELSVFEGLSEHFNRGSVRKVIFESDDKTSFWERPVVKLLSNYKKYDFYAIEKTVFRLSLKRIVKSQSEISGHDVLAVLR